MKHVYRRLIFVVQFQTILCSNQKRYSVFYRRSRLTLFPLQPVCIVQVLVEPVMTGTYMVSMTCSSAPSHHMLYLFQFYTKRRLKLILNCHKSQLRLLLLSKLWLRLYSVYLRLLLATIFVNVVGKSNNMSDRDRGFAILYT